MYKCNILKSLYLPCIYVINLFICGDHNIIKNTQNHNSTNNFIIKYINMIIFYMNFIVKK